MTTSSSNHTALRTIYRHREDAPTKTDVSYIVYATALVLLVVGFPVTRTVVILLSPPEILTLFESPAAERIVGFAGGVLLVLLAAFGSVRGPVLLSPFFVTLLADTATPRSRTLTRSFASASFFVFAGVFFLGIIVGSVRVFGGGLPLLLGLEFAIACLLFAAIASMVWLCGQSLGHRAWILVVGLVALVAGSAAVGASVAFTPWGWLGIVWGRDTTESGVALVALAVLAFGSVSLLPLALNALSRDTLLHQALQWQAAGNAAVTGDLATALGRFRSAPRIGRRWKAVGLRAPWGNSAWARFVRSDAIGAFRTPVRLLGGLAVLTAAFTLLSISLVPNIAPAWLLGAIAAGAAYAGGGVLVDGFRYCAVSAGAPPLYPYSAAQQYALHLTFPLASTASVALVGFWIGMGLGAPLHALVVCLLVALLIVVTRAFDSAKGPPPLILMSSPVPSPAGDPTILILFAWQADALLISAVFAGVIVSLLAVGSIVAIVAISVTVVTGLLMLLQRRLRVS